MAATDGCQPSGTGSILVFTVMKIKNYVRVRKTPMTTAAVWVIVIVINDAFHGFINNEVQIETWDPRTFIAKCGFNSERNAISIARNFLKINNKNVLSKKTTTDSFFPDSGREFVLVFE